MAMGLWLKMCPRCGGDLYLEKDVYGNYVACLQCGHYGEVNKKGEPVLMKTAMTIRRAVPTLDSVASAA